MIWCNSRITMHISAACTRLLYSRYAWIFIRFSIQIELKFASKQKPNRISVVSYIFFSVRMSLLLSGFQLIKDHCRWWMLATAHTFVHCCRRRCCWLPLSLAELCHKTSVPPRRELYTNTQNDGRQNPGRTWDDTKCESQASTQLAVAVHRLTTGA